MLETVLLGIGVLALVGVFVSLCSLLSVVAEFASAYRRPPLQPGDRLVIRSFGQSQLCFVVDVGADGTLLVAPAPDVA